MRMVGAMRMSSEVQDVRETYCTGMKSLSRMPSSRCASSSLRSKLSTDPIWK